MLFCINCGHTLKGYDGGAIGNGFKEQDLTRIVGKLVMAKLTSRGHTVVGCTVDSATSVQEALSSIVAKANRVKADMFISLHLNAFNLLANGTEVFTMNMKEIPQARNVLNEIVKLGFVNRGIKDGKGLAVIRGTLAPAMLVEMCFIDSAKDMKLFNAEKMASAIVKGLIGEDKRVKVPPTNYIKETQILLNKLNLTDSANRKLIVDGFSGPCTREALDKLVKKI